MRASITAALAALVFAAGCASEESRQDLVNAGLLPGVTEDGDTVVCRTIRPTGTRMSERVCRTEREWEEIEEEARLAREDRDGAIAPIDCSAAVQGNSAICGPNQIDGPGR